MKLEYIVLAKSARIPRVFINSNLFLWARSKSLKESLNAREREALHRLPVLRLVFVSRAKIKSLNKLFRGKNKVTDILSFDGSEPGVLGELVICADVVRAQSGRFGVNYRDELLFLILHGILHLLGHEHEKNPRQARKMFAIQKNFFQCLRPNAKGLLHGAFDRVI